MTRKFTANRIDSGAPVTLELSYCDIEECPTSMWAEHAPLIACWHSKYILGHREGKEQLREVIRNSRRYRDSWEERILWTPTDGRYDNKHYLDLDDWSDLALGALKSGCLILPVYIYDHSGIAVSLSPFSCPWDSGQVGLMVWSREQREAHHGKRFKDTKKRRRADIETMKAFFEEWEMYVRGEVYAVTVSDAEGKKQLDCCGGFYGLDYALGSALEEYFAIDPASVQEIAA